MIWLLIPIMALIHRLRGGLIKLPFKLTYYIWPLVGLVGWLLGMPWPAATLWAFGYLIWTVFGWMDEIDEAEGIKPAGQVVSHSDDVTWIEDASFGHKHVAVFLRAAIYLLPTCIVLPYLNEDPAFLLIIIAMFWPSYWIGFKLTPWNPAIFGETGTGAAWGACMACAATFLLS